MPETPAELTIEAVRAALADGPLPVEELCRRLRVDPDDEGPRSVWPLLSGPEVVGLADGRVADGVVLGRGRLALHRLGPEEVAQRIVRLDEDVAGAVAAASDPARVRIGEVEVALRAALDAAGEDDPSADPVVDLPPDWHPDLADGDMVAVAVAADGGLVLTADDRPSRDAGDADAGHDDGATAVRDALLRVGTAWGVPLAGDDDPWVADLIDILLQVAADAPEVLDGLRRPLTEVLDEAELAYGGGFLGGPGVADHRLRLFQVGADVLGGPWADRELLDQAEPLGTAWLLLLGAGDEEIPAEARAIAVAAALTEPDAPVALARHLRSAGVEVGPELLGRVAEVADADPSLAGPAQLLAEARILAGEPEGVGDRLAAALADADPDEWGEAFELLGHLRALAGDLDGAARALARIELHDTVAFLDTWRAPARADVGRNAPCPCGSGRKHKQCCLGKPARTGLAERVPLLWWKARTWCLRTQGLALPWSAVLDTDADGDADALVLDLALVADEALTAFTVEVGTLLPADEAALVETWLERPHRLWEVGERADDGVALTDLTGPADASALTTVRHPHPELEPGEVVLAVVVPVGDDLEQVVGQAVRVPPSTRAAARDLLADHPSGQALLDWALDLGSDALVRPVPGAR